MNTKRSLTLIRIAGLALIVACFGAGEAKAQTKYEGTFTLPFTVRWGVAVLPSGDYTFRIDTAAPPYLVRIIGPSGTSMLTSHGFGTSKNSDHSALIVFRNGAKRTVRALRLAEAGLVIRYPVPKDEQQILAQAPELFQRLPVTMAGK
jgi:hypothetical protein